MTALLPCSQPASLSGLDFFPMPGSAMIGAPDPAHVTAEDFNGGTERVIDLATGVSMYDPKRGPAPA